MGDGDKINDILKSAEDWVDQKKKDGWTQADFAKGLQEMFTTENATVLLDRYKKWIEDGNSIEKEIQKACCELFDQHFNRTGLMRMYTGCFMVFKSQMGVLLVDDGDGAWPIDTFVQPNVICDLFQEMITVVKGLKND